MRFGISATSLICPKNLRTRLRPVNVCCAIVSSTSRRQDFGGPSGARLCTGPRLKIERRPEPRHPHLQEIFPEFAGPKHRTQKNALDATMRPARSNPAFTDYKSPK